MQQTLTTPGGFKVRTRSHRRYVLVGEYFEVGTGVVFKATIVKRTDNLDTGRSAQRREQNRNSGIFQGRSFRFTLMDTTTGRPV